MNVTKADNPRYENPDEQSAGSPASSGRHFSRNARHRETRTLQTAMLARQRTGRRASRMQISTAGSVPHSRLRPNVYDSEGREGGIRQKVTIVLIPVLALTLLYVLRNPLTASTPAQDAQVAEVASAPVPDVEIAWQIPPLYQPGGRDPMRLPTPPVVPVEEPVVAPTEPHMDLIVTGILYSEDRPAAIVDTFLVHEGEQISGATVVKIETDGVEFEMNGRTWKQAVEIDKK